MYAEVNVSCGSFVLLVEFIWRSSDMYSGILVVVGFYLCFATRAIPQQYNQSKSIAFALMSSVLAVAVSFLKYAVVFYIL